MRTMLDRLDVRLPVWNAGMGGGLAGPDLVAAVCEAGGFGVLGAGAIPSELVTGLVRRTRELTSRPFGANVILPMSDGSDVEAVLEERVPVLVLFWGDPQPFVADAHRRDMFVVSQVGNADEAQAAADAGVDAVMIQGTEAGGHVKALAPLETTLREAVAALGSIPVIAAGGIATGEDVATALERGASAVSMGTRFLASDEAFAVKAYKERVVAARAEETVFTDLFDIGWPNANHRVLRNATVEAWEQAGRPAPGQRPGEGEEIGRITIGEDTVPLPRYSVIPAMEGFEGDLESVALYAGESVERIEAVRPAADILRQIHEELRAVTA